MSAPPSGNVHRLKLKDLPSGETTILNSSQVDPNPRSPSRGCLAYLLPLLLFLLAGCSPETGKQASVESSPERMAIPEPDLSEAQPAVREQITKAEAAVDRRVKAGAGVAELAQAYGDLGLVYLTYAFTEAAEAAFINARKIDPADFRWPYLEGYVHHLGGRPQQAEASFETTLELAPGNLPTLIRLGRARLDQNDLAGARQAFAQSRDLSPDTAAVLEGLAKVSAAEGDHARAAALFEEALALQPTANSLYQGLGLTYRSLGRLEDARQALEQGGEALVVFEDPVLIALAKLGRSTDLLMARGARAYTDGRFAEAATFFRRALELDTSDFNLWKQRIFSLEKLGELEEADGEIGRALELASSDDPEADRLERAHLHRMRGMLRLLAKNDQGAIDAFAEALSLSPELVNTRMQMADTLGRQGRFAEALPHYEYLLERQPDRVELRLRRATTLINLGRGREGLADMEKAVELDPTNAEARQRLAAARDYLSRRPTGGASPGASSTRALLAEAEALTASGQAWVLAVLEELWPAAAGPEPLDPRLHARARLAASYAVDSAIRAVDGLASAAGTTASRLDGPWPRLQADVRSVGQHFMVGPQQMQTAGRVLLDQPSGYPAF